MMKVIRFPGDYGRNREILRGWRRWSFPFQTGGGPGIVARDLAKKGGPSEINHGHEITDSENGGAGSGHHVVNLKFRRIDVIAARHAQIAEQELRKKRQVETDEENQRGNARQPFRVHAAGHFWPPKVQAAEVTHDGATDHDVVEMGDDEVGIVDKDVRAQAAEEESGEAADEEKAEEAKGVEHRRVERNRAAVESSRPVKDFHRR